MPASTRRFTPSSERAPSGRRIASSTWPSVTVRQRQTTRPYAGRAAARADHASGERRVTSGIGAGRGSSSSFSAGLPSRSQAMSATMRPIAGAAESPGDSMAAQSTKPGAPGASPMTKSCPGWWARSPAKVRMRSENGTPRTVSAALRMTSARPSAVVSTPPLSSMSSAVGPTSRLPPVVGVTSTPLPRRVGSAKTVCRTCVPAVTSSTWY